VAQGLRNRYQGTPHDPYVNQNPKEPYRPISVMRASLSHITQTRPDLPGDIAVVQYVAMGMPDLGVYMPFYKGLPDLPRPMRALPGTSTTVPCSGVPARCRPWCCRTIRAWPPWPIRPLRISRTDLAALQAAMETEYLALWRRTGMRPGS
jgi:dipeptidase